MRFPLLSNFWWDLIVLHFSTYYHLIPHHSLIINPQKFFWVAPRSRHKLFSETDCGLLTTIVKNVLSKKEGFKKDLIFLILLHCSHWHSHVVRSPSPSEKRLKIKFFD